MQRLLLTIITVLAASTGARAAVPQYETTDEKAAAVTRCAVRLRTACADMWRGQAGADVAAEADTLAAALYADTVQIPLVRQVQGRIALENYNLLAAPQKVNYKELRAALNSCHKVETFHDNFFITGATAVADKAFAEEDWTLAKLYYIRALKAIATAYGDRHIPPEEYCHLRLAYIANKEQARDDEALWCMSLVLDRAELYGMQSEEFNDAVEMAALSLPFMSDRAKAKDYYGKLMAYLEGENLTGTDAYASLLHTRAALAEDEHDYATATAMYARLLDALRLENEDYVDVAAAAACYFYGRRDYEPMNRALAMCVEAFERGGGTVAELGGVLPVLNAAVADKSMPARMLRAMEERLDVENPYDLCAYASLLHQSGERERARDVADKVRGMCENLLLYPEMSMEYARLSGQVATMYSHLGNIAAAIDFLRASIPATERAYPGFPSIAWSMRVLLAGYLQLNGDLRGCMDMHEQCLADAASDADRTDLLMAILRTRLAAGDYEGAITQIGDMLVDNPADTERWSLLTDKAGALISLIDVAYPQGSDLREGAERELDKTVAELAQTGATDPERRFMQQVYAATAAFLANDDARMLAAADSAAALLPQMSAALGVDYGASLAMYYVKAGQYDRAEALLGEEWPEDTDVERMYRRQLLAEIALGRADTATAQQHYIAMCEDITAMVRRQFATLDAGTRAAYWRMFSRQIQDAGRFASEENVPSEFAAAVYNLELFSKGLLLNSENAIARAIAASGNAELQRRYREYRAGTGKDAAAERYILDAVAESADYTSQLTPDWRDVQAALAPDETAIEFVQYSDINCTRYIAAAVVKPGLQVPVFVKIGREDDIAASVDEDFDGTALWQPLAPYIAPGGKVYFAASGELHRLPVEWCAGAPDARLFRVSSTRELAAERSAFEREGVCVAFGDIDYGSAPSAGGSGKRDGDAVLDALPGTAREIKALASLVPALRLHCYTGRDAAKDSLLRAPAFAPSLLHVGTHGYFDYGAESASALSPAFRAEGLEERSLASTGLYFAGANEALADSARNIDDHRVNSLEISAMDFGTLDLVVLSACETAAGDVTGEGVFGLQRGFKKAGARSLLMSLWKVDDAATALLMTEFYRRLFGDPAAGIAPQGAHAALEAAKDIVKNTPGMESPEYWAAFILLDAID